MESNDPSIVGKPCNIGNPREMSMNELVLAIEQVIGHGVAKTKRPFPVDDPKMRKPDIELARRALDWDPKVKLEDGIKITIDWFKEELGNL
jgi:nucleoside-diphosphate-sugar epimerase